MFATKMWHLVHCVLLPLLLSQARTLPLGSASNAEDEIILVEEVMRYGTDFGANATATLITLNGNGTAVTLRRDNVDNESLMDTSAGAADDLIFLTAKKPTHLQQKSHHRGIHQIDLLTVDDLSESASFSFESVLQEDPVTVDGVPHEIELQTDDLSPASLGTASRPHIEMFDFVALIPAEEVKSIVANYYRNDPEVQRAYAFLSGPEFSTLKLQLIAVPEISAFLRYLNASGLDVVKFLYTLSNLTSQPVVRVPDENENQFSTATNIYRGNERNEIINNSATTEKLTPTTAAGESLNGLHGLVDSILDILPQDQILSTFFDKLESNEQFSKLVDNVGSPEFAKILHNMQNSVPLRNLIFTLHNNGIYVTRIVDSLKAYFFLGTF